MTATRQGGAIRLPYTQVAADGGQINRANMFSCNFHAGLSSNGIFLAVSHLVPRIYNRFTENQVVTSSGTTANKDTVEKAIKLLRSNIGTNIEFVAIPNDITLYQPLT